RTRGKQQANCAHFHCDLPKRGTGLLHKTWGRSTCPWASARRNADLIPVPVSSVFSSVFSSVTKSHRRRRRFGPETDGSSSEYGSGLPDLQLIVSQGSCCRILSTCFL